MSPLKRLALRIEAGEGLVGYLLVLAPFAAVIGLVILTLILSQPSAR